MALSDYIESLKEEPDTREVPFAKKYPPVAERLPRFASIQPTSTSGGRHRQGMIIPEEEKKKQQEGGGGMSPQQAWDAYQQYKGEGASEGASSGTSTTGAGSSAAGGEQGLGYMSGTGSTTAYSSGYPVQGMAGGQATAGSQGLGYMGGTGATATGSTAGGSMAGSTGAIALYAILGSLGQKWATKEQMSDDPDRGPTSRKARVFSALAPSAMHAIKDPGGEGIYQLTGHSPVMSLLGKDQGKKGETESEGYKIWEWIGKLFD